MPISPEFITALAGQVLQLAGATEVAVAQAVANRVGRDVGDDAIGPNVRSVQLLQAELLRLAAKFTTDVSPELQAAIERGAWEGRAQAVADLKRALGHLRGLSPNLDALINLAAELIAPVSDRALVGGGILRAGTDAYRTAVARATSGVLLGAQTRRQAAQMALDQWARRGVAAFRDSRGRTWDLATYAEMATRTAAQRAMVDAHSETLLADGVRLVIVSNAPQECARCVVPGTLITGPAPSARWATQYSGDIVTVRTASGNVLSATPNHPVLTSLGWRKLKDLKPGDQVISDHGIQRHADVMPDDVEVPSRVEELGEFRLPLFRTGPSRSDFDGNVSYGDVDVVWPEGALLDERHPAPTKPLSDLGFVDRIRLASLGARQRDPLLALVGNDAATGGGMGGIEHGGTLLGGGGFPPLEHLLADGSTPLFGGASGLPGHDAGMARPGLDSGALQIVTDHARADSEGGAELLRGLAGQVAPDEVVSLDVRQFSGHVWDLTTGPAWFVSNGIISHNCRPWEGKVLAIGMGQHGYPSLAEAERAGLFHNNCRHSIGAYIPGVTKPHAGPTADPKGDEARQRLRYLERQVRAAKRLEAVALDDDARKQARAKVRGAQAAIRAHLETPDGSRLARQPARERIGSAR